VTSDPRASPVIRSDIKSHRPTTNPVQSLRRLLIAASPLLLLVAVLGACGGSDGHPRGRVEELARVTSPDSLVDAVFTRTNSHATVPYVYRVYIVARGTATQRDRVAEVFRADHVDGASLAWPRAGLLEIRYARARIFHFTNFWSAGEVRNFTYEVGIRLRPTEPPE